MSEILKTYGLMSNESEEKIKDKKSSLDRFGDDLTELILSYLPISEKIRLECTSKQVQSLIFNKQKCLRICYIYSSEVTDNDLNELLLKSTDCEMKINCRAFGTVLKRFDNLDTIKILGLIDINTDLIDTIAHNCRQLKTLWFSERSFCHRFDIRGHNIEESLKSLAHKCEPTLQSLKFDCYSKRHVRQLMSSLPQLRSVTVDDIKSIISEHNIYEKYVNNSEELPKFFPKLQEIEFRECNEKTLNQFQNEYSDNLLKISALLRIQDLRTEAILRGLAGFGRFRRLQSLDLCVLNSDFVSEQFIYNGLRQLAEECLQLKRMSFTLIHSIHLDNDWFSIFSSLNSLSSLTMCLWDCFPLPYGRISGLRNLTKLKHLDLTLRQITDLFVEDMDKYLPQLVSVRFETTKAITDKSLNILSQMKCLSKLEIICCTTEEDHNITDSGVKQLIDGCPRIRSLSLEQQNPSFDFDITEESIKAMILRSKRMPKIEHNFSFFMNSVEKRSHLTKLLTNLPQNLSLKINVQKSNRDIEYIPFYPINFCL